MTRVKVRRPEEEPGRLTIMMMVQDERKRKLTGSKSLSMASTASSNSAKLYNYILPEGGKTAETGITSHVSMLRKCIS